MFVDCGNWVKFGKLLKNLSKKLLLALIVNNWVKQTLVKLEMGNASEMIEEMGNFVA